MQSWSRLSSRIPTPPTSTKTPLESWDSNPRCEPNIRMLEISWKIPIYTWRFQYISKLWKFNYVWWYLRFRTTQWSDQHPFKAQIPRRTPGHLSWLLDQCNQLRCPPIKPDPNWCHYPSRKMACHSSKCYSYRSNPSKLDGQICHFVGSLTSRPDVTSLASEFRSTHSFFRCQKWGWASKGQMYLSSATAP